MSKPVFKRDSSPFGGIDYNIFLDGEEIGTSNKGDDATCHQITLDLPGNKDMASWAFDAAYENDFEKVNDMKSYTADFMEFWAKAQEYAAQYICPKPEGAGEFITVLPDGREVKLTIVAKEERFFPTLLVDGKEEIITYEPRPIEHIQEVFSNMYRNYFCCGLAKKLGYADKI